jgi:catechol 2,3-dioxygenase-like lactoylglutathione lyase family enzyme
MAKNVFQITPFIHVEDIEAGVAFLTDVLGFKPMFVMANFALVERDGCAIRLLAEPGQFQKGNRRYNIMIDVTDLEALHAELKPKLDKLPKRNVRGPVDRPYGLRELMVLGPDGNFIVFAQVIDRVATTRTTGRVAH